MDQNETLRLATAIFGENSPEVQSVKEPMHLYQFRDTAPEVQRDSLTLTLRKDGFKASRETDTLRTNATLAQIALSYGHSLIVSPLAYDIENGLTITEERARCNNP